MTSPEALDLRLVPAALAAWLVAWQVRLVPPGGAVLAAVGLAVLGVVLLVRSPRRSAAGLAAVLLVAAAAATCTAARVQARDAGPLAVLAERGAAVVVEGVLIEDAREVGPQPGGRPLVVTRMRVELVTSAGRSHRLRSPVLVLSAQTRWLALLPGQRVRAEGRLRPTESGDDVAAVLSDRGAPVLLGHPGLLQRGAGRLRAGLREAAAVLPDAERGLLPGLVVGDTAGLDDDLRADFRTVGLTHLVAVSGTNCAIIAGAVLLLARRLGLGLRLAPVAAGLALAGFVVLVRPSPSVLRAAVMGGVALLALATGSRRQAVPALAGSVLVLVLVDPDLAATAGFALSVLATGGLLLMVPSWTEVLSQWMPRPLAQALAVPAAAQVACGPVVVVLAGTLGLLSVPANLLAAPAVAPATVLGVLCALVAPLSMPCAQALAWLAWVPTLWLVRVARLGARLPGAQVDWPDGLPGALSLLALTGMAAAVLSRPWSRRLSAALAVGALLAVAGLGALRPGWPPPGWFLVTCDVGQGDAHVLSVGVGAAVVVDAGPDPRAVDRCLRRLHIEAVPLVLLTHLHADHVDGLSGVLGGRRVGQVEIGPLAEPAQQWQQVQRTAAKAHVPLVAAALGEVRTAGALQWEVLAPSHAYRGSSSDPNNSSVVVRLRVAGLRVLLTGDVEPQAQRDLVRSVPDLRSDVLKVPHHGSAHQDPAFLDAVRPRLALTSVGTDNGYGHPSADILGRLLAGGARSYRTDRDGDVALALRDGRLVSSGRSGPGTVSAALGPRGRRPPERGPMTHAAAWPDRGEGAYPLLSPAPEAAAAHASSRSVELLSAGLRRTPPGVARGPPQTR